jgi:hypothetical protein
MNANKSDHSKRLEADLLSLVGQMLNLAVKQRKSFAVLFADLLRPYAGRPPTPLHEALHAAAKRAGWTTPSAKAQLSVVR